MSKMKEYLEQVSIELDYDGEINDEVIVRAAVRLSVSMPQQARIVSHLRATRKDTTRPSFSVENRINWRADKRAELICRHGIGHPSLLLMQRREGRSDTIHGCDGCCSRPEFKEVEEELLLKQTEGRS